MIKIRHVILDIIVAALACSIVFGIDYWVLWKWGNDNILYGTPTYGCMMGYYKIARGKRYFEKDYEASIVFFDTYYGIQKKTFLPASQAVGRAKIGNLYLVVHTRSAGTVLLNSPIYTNLSDEIVIYTEK